MSDEKTDRRQPGSGSGIDTRLAHAGRDPQAFHGFVNPPVVRASTVLFPTFEALSDHFGQRYPYGLTNTPTIEALADALTELDGAAGTVLLPSGLSAVSLALMLAAKPGARVLVPDNVYFPTRRFCDAVLTRLGVETVYYDPMVGSGIDALVGGTTTAIFMEAPGSHTFETPDVPTLVAAARRVGALTMLDNTWATPLIFRPLDFGVDLAIMAGTKYVAGHSDVMVGSVAANAAHFPALKQIHRNFGNQAGTEEIWLTLRGLRTMGVRIERHEKNALAVAHWLSGHDKVRKVLHPAFPATPGHEFWKRDFGRSTGLFAFELDGDEAGLAAFLDALRIFGLGYSWGGFESLAAPSELGPARTAVPWTGGPLIRLHVGLEDPVDLIADLERGFAAVSG